MMDVRFRTLAAVAVLATTIGYLLVSLRVGAARGDAQDAGGHPLSPPFVMYRALAPREAHGRVAVMGLGPDGQPHVSRLTCSRVHYAGGRGLCATLEPSAGNVAHVVQVFDERLAPGKRVVLDGVPTRLRVAPDGHLGAITTYGEEEGPDGERLATRTRIIDMKTAHFLADLRDFRVESSGHPPIRGPIDIASVAFERDGERFFATLAADNERYLVAGSISERRLTLLRAGVASEALSPDGRRLIVKRLLSERGFWQLAVVDLGTWAEHDLQQGARSVDDQVEWLDDEHVVYHDADGEGTALWMLPIDGVNGPRILVRDAYSAAVQR
jgi:hypothetical protein